jgi:hypothetical protein
MQRPVRPTELSKHCRLSSERASSWLLRLSNFCPYPPPSSVLHIHKSAMVSIGAQINKPANEARRETPGSWTSCTEPQGRPPAPLFRRRRKGSAKIAAHEEAMIARTRQRKPLYNRPCGASVAIPRRRCPRILSPLHESRTFRQEGRGLHSHLGRRPRCALASRRAIRLETL